MKFVIKLHKDRWCLVCTEDDKSGFVLMRFDTYLNARDERMWRRTDYLLRKADYETWFKEQRRYNEGYVSL
jgi:hypothetical protein